MQYIDIQNYVLTKLLTINDKSFLINVDFQVCQNGTFIKNSLTEVAIKPVEQKEGWQPVDAEYILDIAKEIIEQEMIYDSRMIETVKDAISTVFED